MSAQQPLDMSELSKQNLNVKSWINAMLAKTAVSAGSSDVSDVHVQQLLTRLQLHHQETTTALEDTITQAIVRLPRAAMEVERMGQEAQDLSTRLADAAANAIPIVESIPPQAETLQRLRRAKDKLSKCTKILQKAKLLHLQIEELENAARSGNFHHHNNGSGSKAPEEDSEMERVASAVAEVHANLREVQLVDPTFGTAMESRIRSLESDLQSNVERECFDLLKKQDKVKAPRLLATLQKINRGGLVMEQYLSFVVNSRKAQLASDLKSLQSQPSSGKGEGCAVVLSQHYRGVGKLFAREVDYIRCLMKSAEGPLEPSSPAHSQVLELIEKLVHATGDIVVPVLESLASNVDITRSYDSLEEISKGVFQHDPKFSDHILLEQLHGGFQKHFELLVQLFLQREQDTIRQSTDKFLSTSAVRDVDPHLFRGAVETICSSLDRALLFFARLTVTPLVECAVAALAAAVSSIGSAATAEARLINSSNSSTNVQRIQDAFHKHDAFKQCVKHLRALVDSSTDTSAASTSNSWAARALQKQMIAASVFDSLILAEKRALDETSNAVCITMMAPFVRIAEQYSHSNLWTGNTGAPKTLVAYSIGQVAPSDLIRAMGAEMMEVPMTLDNLESELEDEDGQVWLVRLVSLVVDLFLTETKKIEIRTSPNISPTAQQRALEQLICDVEYLMNVLSAVSESSFENTLGMSITKLQERLAQERALANEGKPLTDTIRIQEILS